MVTAFHHNIATPCVMALNDSALRVAAEFIAVDIRSNSRELQFLAFMVSKTWVIPFKTSEQRP